MSEILHIHPKRLVFAESLAAVPMLGTIADHYAKASKADLREEAAEISAAKAALWSTLDAHGIRDAIPVTAKGRGKYTAWDGRHRTEWAMAKDLKTVPVKHVTETEGRAILESSVVGRRHWTKGQLAWLAVNLHPSVAGNSKGRPKKSDSVGISAVDLAARFGVSADSVDQAVKIYRLCSEAPSLRAKYEPSIWLGHGLGAVLAGIPGGETTAGKPKPALGFKSLAGPLASLNRIAGAFKGWAADERDACRDSLTAWISALPPEFRLTLTEAVARSADGEDAGA